MFTFGERGTKHRIHTLVAVHTHTQTYTDTHGQLSLPQNSSSPKRSKFLHFLSFSSSLFDFIRLFTFSVLRLRHLAPRGQLEGDYGYKSLEVWRCCHLESEIASVHMRACLKKLSSNLITCSGEGR